MLDKWKYIFEGWLKSWACEHGDDDDVDDVDDDDYDYDVHVNDDDVVDDVDDNDNNI